MCLFSVVEIDKNNCFLTFYKQIIVIIIVIDLFAPGKIVIDPNPDSYNYYNKYIFQLKLSP